MDNRYSKDEFIRQIIVTIDGPAGSGKTTTAGLVARRLRLRHLDTGAMYRAATLKCLRLRADLGNAESAGHVAHRCSIAFIDPSASGQRVVLDGEDVTDAIRSPEVTKHVSLVSSYGEVRRAMVAHQRRLASSGGVVMEGRDTGSVVFPAAHVKIYLDATLEERAARRLRDLRAQGIEAEFDTIQVQIEERDRLDSKRKHSPLKVPVGARVVDTTELSIQEAVERVVAIVDDAAQSLAALVVSRGEGNPYRRHRRRWIVGSGSLWLVLKVIWGLRVVRREPLEFRENYIFASNHLSNADPPILGATLSREVSFVAKGELFKNRAFGWFISRWRAIPLRRGIFDRRAMEQFLRNLEQGKSVLIFPEGARVAGGDLGPPKAGVGYLALKSGAPVVPIYIRGSNTLVRALRRSPRLQVVHGRPIRLTDSDLSRYGRNDYREFSRMVMWAIAALKEEVEASGGPEGG